MISNNPTLSAFFTWLAIREQNGLHLTNAEDLQKDAEHSSLLCRLLAGKKPYAKRPPQRYGYPWYELYDKGSAEESDVIFDTELRSVRICKYTWTIVECLSPYTRFLVRPGSGSHTLLASEADSTVWELQETDQKTGWGSTLWSLKRYNDEYGMQNLSSSESQCAVLQEQEGKA